MLIVTSLPLMLMQEPLVMAVVMFADIVYSPRFVIVQQLEKVAPHAASGVSAELTEPLSAMPCADSSFFASAAAGLAAIASARVRAMAPPARPIQVALEHRAEFLEIFTACLDPPVAPGGLLHFAASTECPFVPYA
ncbi:MAG: hypothetical protein ACYDC3_10100 [Candidatus Binataceae bacterium]